MNNVFVLFLFFVICTASPVPYYTFAQALRDTAKSDTTRFFINHTATGMINHTNEGSAYLANNTLKFNIARKSINLNTINSWIYGEQSTGLTNNDFSSAADFNLYKTIRNFYYWGLGTFDKSYSLKINNRVQSGLGVGYNVVNRPAFIFVLSDGFLYEYVNLYGSETYDSLKYHTIRNSLRVKFKLIMLKIVTLEGTNFWQPSILDFEDYIIKSNTTLAIKLKDWLSLAVVVTYNKLSITRRENLLCNIGFTFQRYF